jgi:hypothetical protein
MTPTTFGWRKKLPREEWGDRLQALPTARVSALVEQGPSQSWRLRKGVSSSTSSRVGLRGRFIPRGSVKYTLPGPTSGPASPKARVPTG